jgi:CHAT domain-containing protein
MNVSRAFLLAGSEFVVGAVGEVDDELSLALTRRFYAALESGAEPLSALRTAVLAVRADEHIDADVRAQWHRVRAFVR